MRVFLIYFIAFLCNVIRRMVCNEFVKIIFKRYRQHGTLFCLLVLYKKKIRKVNFSNSNKINSITYEKGSPNYDRVGEPF